MFKRKIFFFVLIALCLILGIDGTLLAKNNQLGIKVGFNYSDFYGKRAEGWRPINGIQLGTFFNMSINNFLSIQPEIIFAQKGSEIDELYAMGYRYHFKATVNYLETSLLTMLKIPISKKIIEPFLYCGPAISYKLSSATTGSFPCPFCSYYILDINKKYDTSFLFGTNIYLSMLSKKLLIDVRYFLGLISIDEYGDMFNQVFSVSLGCNIF